MRLWVPTLCVLLVTIGSACGFEMNLTPAEARSRLELFAVEDLLVGDSGRLRVLTFCTRHGELFVPSDALLTDYKGRYSFIVTREPDNSVSLQTVIEQPAATSEQDMKEADETIARTLLYSLTIECPENARLLTISSVNDQTSFDGLLAP